MEGAGGVGGGRWDGGGQWDGGGRAGGRMVESGALGARNVNWEDCFNKALIADAEWWVVVGPHRQTGRRLGHRQQGERDRWTVC